VPAFAEWEQRRRLRISVRPTIFVRRAQLTEWRDKIPRSPKVCCFHSEKRPTVASSFLEPTIFRTPLSNAPRLISAGLPVALGHRLQSRELAPHPACRSSSRLHAPQMKMSPAEAIAAATINGAWALRLAERKGSIEREGCGFGCLST